MTANSTQGARLVNIETATAPRTAPIEVIALKLLADAGALRAFASVRLGGVIVHDCRIIQQSGQRPWVSLPQREYLHDGQKKYASVVEVSDSLKRELCRVVLAEWAREGGE